MGCFLHSGSFISVLSVVLFRVYIPLSTRSNAYYIVDWLTITTCIQLWDLVIMHDDVNRTKGHALYIVLL